MFILVFPLHKVVLCMSVSRWNYGDSDGYFSLQLHPKKRLDQHSSAHVSGFEAVKGSSVCVCPRTSLMRGEERGGQRAAVSEINQIIPA